jgi:hypothetical protein
LERVEKVLFEKTEVGKQLYQSSQETQQAIKALQDASKDGGLTREKLLDLIVNAKTDTEVSTLTSLARNGMDYTFFQQLSQKIDDAKGNEKERLSALRETLLDLTPRSINGYRLNSNKPKNCWNPSSSADDIEAETQKNFDNITELFLQVVEDEIEKARKQADLDRIQKLERVMIVVRKAMEPPAEVQLIEEMLALVDKPEDLNKFLDEHQDKITPDFIQLLNGIISQGGNAPEESIQQIQQLYKTLLRYSMKKNLADK